MDHIEQLKKIRAEAIARLRNSSDFKLAGKLGLLIVELGETVDDKLDYEAPSKPLFSPFSSAKTPEASTVEPEVQSRPFEPLTPAAKSTDDEDAVSDEMIEELVAEIEGDAAEIDALLADDKQESAVSDTLLKPFLSSVKPDAKYSNGASH